MGVLKKVKGEMKPDLNDLRKAIQVSPELGLKVLDDLEACLRRELVETRWKLLEAEKRIRCVGTPASTALMRDFNHYAVKIQVLKEILGVLGVGERRMNPPCRCEKKVKDNRWEEE